MKKHLVTMQIAIMSMIGMIVSPMASAALSTEIATGLTALQTDALALVDLVWPVVVAISVAFIMFKLFKRGINKA